MWEVWLYIGDQRKLIHRFHSRNEAEHCGRSYQRLIGTAAQLTVCFAP
jgi:hypothetical protein